MSTEPVKLYLGAGCVECAHSFTTYFDNFLINSGSTTYNKGFLRMTEHDFGKQVQLKNLTIDADLPGDSKIEVDLYIKETDAAAWEKVGTYTFTSDGQVIDLPAGTYAKKVKYGISGTEGIKLIASDADNVPVLHSFNLSVEQPTISIYTDEFEYSPSDIMTITIDIANPTENSTTFQWYWVVPQFSVCVPVMSVPIPVGYDDTLNFSFKIPDWGPTSFGNVFYVQLLNTSSRVLDIDTASWAYSPGREAMPAAEVDISKEIKKTIEKIG